MCLAITKSFKDSPPPSRTIVYKVFTLKTGKDGNRSLFSPLFTGEPVNEFELFQAYNSFEVNGRTRKTKATKRAFLRSNKFLDNNKDFNSGLIHGGVAHCFIDLEPAARSDLFKNRYGSVKRVIVRGSVNKNDWIADGTDSEAGYLQIQLLEIVAANRNCLLK